jgi:hypothetical protein
MQTTALRAEIGDVWRSFLSLVPSAFSRASFAWCA